MSWECQALQDSLDHQHLLCYVSMYAFPGCFSQYLSTVKHGQAQINQRTWHVATIALKSLQKIGECFQVYDICGSK